MGPGKSETKHVNDWDGDHYESKVIDKDGNVYKGEGRTSEEAQKSASDKKEDGTPSWKPGWW